MKKRRDDETTKRRNNTKTKRRNGEDEDEDEHEDEDEDEHDDDIDDNDNQSAARRSEATISRDRGPPLREATQIGPRSLCGVWLLVSS